MYRWLVKKVGKLWALLIVIALVLAALVGGYESIKNYFTAGLKTEVKVSRGRTGAAIESGNQAVNTVGNRQSAEENGAAVVEEAQHAIDNATDPAGVTDAGLNGLHSVRGKAGDRNRR